MVKKIFSYILVGGIFVFLFWNIVQNREYISSVNWILKSSDIFLFILFVIFIYVSNILSWHIVTKFLGLELSIFSNAKIWMISNFSRFIPGGIWQYPSRVILLAKKGVDKKSAITAVLIEG